MSFLMGKNIPMAALFIVAKYHGMAGRVPNLLALVTVDSANVLSFSAHIH